MEEGKRKSLNQNKQANQRGLIVDEKRRTLLKGGDRAWDGSIDFALVKKSLTAFKNKVYSTKGIFYKRFS